MYELDNNSIERQMKYIAIGRKNYYFAGWHEGARRAAVLYSLLGTCRLNKVNPWEWLSDVLVRVNVRSDDTAVSNYPFSPPFRSSSSSDTSCGGVLGTLPESCDAVLART